MRGLLLFLSLPGLLTIPCFLCCIIALVVQKQWKRLAFTLGNIVVFWGPEVVLACNLIPKMIVREYAMQFLLVLNEDIGFADWLPAVFLLVPCIQPVYMLLDSVRRKQGRGLVFASAMAVGMNWGWICFTALCVIFGMMGV